MEEKGEEVTELSDSMIEAIAEKAAEKAIRKLTEHVYQEVGRGVVTKFTWLLGATIVGLYLWLQSQGVIK